MIFQYIPEITKSQKSQRERKASQSGANSLNVFEGFEDRFAQGGREAGSAIEQSGSKAGNALAAKLSAAGDQFAASIAGSVLEAIDRGIRKINGIGNVNGKTGRTMPPEALFPRGVGAGGY